MATEQNLESVTSRSHASTTITPLDTGAPVAGNDETDIERHSSAGQQSMSSRMLAVLSAGRPPWRCSLGSTSCPPNPRQPPPARPPSSARREVRRRSNSFCSNKNTLASSGADDDRVICGTVLDLENPVEKSQDVVGNGLVATDGGTWEDKGGNCAVASSSHGEIIARRFSARKILAPLTLCSSSTADEGCGYYDSHRHQREREQSKKQSQRHRCSQKEQEHLWQHQQRVEKRQRLREKKKREEEYSQKYKEYGERERRTRGRQMLEDLLGAFCHAITRRLIDVPAPHRYVTTPHYRNENISSSKLYSAVPYRDERVACASPYETRRRDDTSQQPKRSRTCPTRKVVDATRRMGELTQEVLDRMKVDSEGVCELVRKSRKPIPAPPITWAAMEAPPIELSGECKSSPFPGMLSLSSEPLEEGVDCVTNFVVVTKKVGLAAHGNDTTNIAERGVDTKNVGNGPPEPCNGCSTPLTVQVAVPNTHLNSLTVRHIKQEVEKQLGVNAAQQLLFVNDVVLRDDVPLSFLHPSMVIQMENSAWKSQEALTTEKEASKPDGDGSEQKVQTLLVKEVRDKKEQEGEPLQTPNNEPQPPPHQQQELQSQPPQEQSTKTQQQQHVKTPSHEQHIQQQLQQLQELQSQSETSHRMQQQSMMKEKAASDTPLSTLQRSPARPSRPAPSPAVKTLTPTQWPQAARGAGGSSAATATPEVAATISAKTAVAPTVPPRAVATTHSPGSGVHISAAERDPVAVGSINRSNSAELLDLPDDVCDGGEMLEDIISSTIEQMKMLDSLQRKVLRA